MVSAKVLVAVIATLFSKVVISAPVLPVVPATKAFEHFQQCEDIPLGTANTTSGKVCLEPLISDEILSHMPAQTNTTLSKRFESYRSDLESLSDGSKLWCAKPSRGAPQPRQQDVHKLCHNLSDDIVVGRNTAADTAFQNMALCQIFDEGTARYRVCNLDKCAEQTFLSNKRSCFQLNNKCPKVGAYSGYLVGKSAEGRGRATALTGTRMMGDYAFEHNDDKFFVQQFESTCMA
jgi:hypothetical protein